MEPCSINGSKYRYVPKQTSTSFESFALEQPINPKHFHIEHLYIQKATQPHHINRVLDIWTAHIHLEAKINRKRQHVDLGRLRLSVGTEVRTSTTDGFYYHSTGLSGFEKKKTCWKLVRNEGIFNWRLRMIKVLQHYHLVDFSGITCFIKFKSVHWFVKFFLIFW